MNGRSNPPSRGQLPGLGLLLGVGAAAQVVAATVGGNALGTPAWAAPGVRNHSLFLETGIGLLGASIAIGDLIGAGPWVIGLVVATVAFSLALVEAIARGAFGLRERTASLLAAGTSICGVSAVAAVGQVIDTRGDQLTYAAATIVFFDAATLVVYPALGDLLGLSMFILSAIRP